MSNIINVVANDDFTLLIELEKGNKIIFNMQSLIKTIPFSSLNNPECFKKLMIDGKAIYWQGASNSKPNLLPIRLTLDNILFAIRD